MDASEPVVSTRRLDALTAGQIQTALDRFDLGRFLRAEPASDGLFGQNVFITSDSGEHVLRGAPHYDWQFPTERFFAQLLHERTAAPTPWPYLLDPLDDIFGWSYVLMPRMPGRHFTDSAWFATLSMNDRVSIAGALGKTLADLHALTWPIAGAYDPKEDRVRPFPNGYGAWVIERIEASLAEATALSAHTTQEDVAWARALISSGRDALLVPFQPRVVMEDYHPGNVTIVGESGRWRVGGVFDLMTLRFGDGEADLARLGRMYAYEEPRLAQAFVRAYFDRRPPRPGFTQRFPVYLLHDSLIIWAYCVRNNDIWWPDGYTLRDWVEETLGILHSQSLLDG